MLHINIFPMTNPKNQNNQSAVLDFTNKTIVTHSISPEAFMLPLQWRANGSWRGVIFNQPIRKNAKLGLGV